MDYLRHIISPHGVSLILLMLVSTGAMSRIFTQLGDLKSQVAAIGDLGPHLRAALSTGNTAKAAVAAESDTSALGKLMSAILAQASQGPVRMRLIYKMNIDDELRTRLRYLASLKRWGVVGLVIGIIGALVGLWTSPSAAASMKNALVVGVGGVVVFLYAMVFFSILKKRELELNDILAAEALNLIDAASRGAAEEEEE